MICVDAQVSNGGLSSLKIQVVVCFSSHGSVLLISSLWGWKWTLSCKPETVTYYLPV